jgi:hypothetical protein
VNSKRSLEGYLMLDHRASAGVPDELVVAAGLPPGAGRGLFESATFTCSHCHAIVIMNPDRSRAREWCKGCDRYLCDGCGKRRANDFTCTPLDKVIDQIRNDAA